MKKRTKIILGPLLGVIILGSISGGWWYYKNYMRNPPNDLAYVQYPDLETTPLTSLVAENVELPWAMDFFPNGDLIFTERSGRVRLIPNGTWNDIREIAIIDEVNHIGEGGLLGLTLHPLYPVEPFIYIYYTYSDGEEILDKVVRYNYTSQTFIEPLTIIEDIPGASYHDGGRIKFGPDEKLYITTGDAGNTSSAQDINSLAGKILRLNPNGTIPDDNPFAGSPVYSMGHRNPQGLTWDNLNRLWATEHGSTSTDELNLILPGENYGWPIIRGDDEDPAYLSPVIHSGYSTTWAPSGLAFVGGTLYWAGLRGQSLYYTDNVGDYPDNNIELKTIFKNQFGRIREVVAGPDGFLYISTSNLDGRNPNPEENDDLIIRVNPTKI